MKRIASTLMIVALSLFGFLPNSSAAKLGSSCTKTNSKSWDGDKPIVCQKNSKGKLVWTAFKNSAASNSSTNSSTNSSVKETLGQINAKRKAASYLSFSGFSRTGLIKQLEFEGYSTADAIYGTDAQKADWKEQAAKKAKSYLSTTAFSKTGLIKQLEFEGFSNAEATFGVEAQKTDWKAEAVKKAKSYLATSAFSKAELISQLIFEGFTDAEAAYGVEKVGYTS